MKLSHEEIKELFPEYLRGSVPEEIRNSIETHIKGCKECRDELSFISELVKVDVPDPGDLYWNTLPQKIKASAKKEKSAIFSLKSLLAKQLPVAATIAVLIFSVLIFTKKKETPELDLYLKGPHTTAVLNDDYIGNLNEEDISIITELPQVDEFPLYSENLMGRSYYKEFASLNSEEMESLYEALKIEQKRGG
jgi:hypothetical protein